MKASIQRLIALVEPEAGHVHHLQEPQQPQRKRMRVSPSSPDLGAELLLCLAKKNSKTESPDEVAMRRAAQVQSPHYIPLDTDDEDDIAPSKRANVTPQILRHVVRKTDGSKCVVGPLPPAPILPNVAAGVIFA